MLLFPRVVPNHCYPLRFHFPSPLSFPITFPLLTPSRPLTMLPPRHLSPVSPSPPCLPLPLSLLGSFFSGARVGFFRCGACVRRPYYYVRVRSYVHRIMPLFPCCFLLILRLKNNRWISYFSLATRGYPCFFLNDLPIDVIRMKFCASPDFSTTRDFPTTRCILAHEMKRLGDFALLISPRRLRRDTTFSERIQNWIP